MKTLLAFLPLAALLLLAGCAKKDSTASGSRPSALDSGLDGSAVVTVQLDWVAEPEHGGFYQALAKGYFKDAGLDVKIIPGGPNAFVMQKLATSRVDIGEADSTNTLLAIARGIPVIQVGAIFQHDPSVLMLHDENPVRTFADLNGKTLMARPEWAFLPYLRKKYGIDFKLVPQNYSVANFIADPALIQQGYFISEPYHIIKGGGQMPRFLYAWDSGFDAYTVLAANRPWSEAHPAQLRAFLRAYIHGWRDYLTGDPAPANALLKQANPENTDAFLKFSRQMIIDHDLVTGPKPGPDLTGQISPARFATEITQLETLGILPKGQVTVDQAMTTAYLP